MAVAAKKLVKMCLGETESFTATHNFQLTSYRLLDGMGVGKYVSSGTFTAVTIGASNSIQMGGTMAVLATRRPIWSVSVPAQQMS